MFKYLNNASGSEVDCYLCRSRLGVIRLVCIEKIQEEYLSKGHSLDPCWCRESRRKVSVSRALGKKFKYLVIE